VIGCLSQTGAQKSIVRQGCKAGCGHMNSENFCAFQSKT
jgi:hypothetical protein